MIPFDDYNQPEYNWLQDQIYVCKHLSSALKKKKQQQAYLLVHSLQFYAFE